MAQPIDAEVNNAAQTVVFTIVSRNYFHYARNLMASVAEHMPGTKRVVVICDALQGLEEADSTVELLGIEALGIGPVDRMQVHYTILELNTAIKPFAFERLFERAGVQRVIYFDPDIQLFSSGQPLLQRLQEADVVLTPHLLAPLADERHPSDLSIVQSGTYNLGFLALARSEQTLSLLRWWQGKLVRDCVVDIPRGLFTDQKWMDLVPGLFDRVFVERHPGWNVAYWNLLHRDVTQSGDRFFVNGQALFFFHFSGYDPKSATISKHQDRFKLADCSAATQVLFNQYTQRLIGFGRERFAALPYAFSTLADGTRIPDVARALIRNELPDEPGLPDLRSAAGAKAVIQFLTQAVDDQQPPISRLARQLWNMRADLRAAFPDLLGSHREAYVNWFGERAGPEAGIAGVLAQGVGGRQPGPAPIPVAAAPMPPGDAVTPDAAGGTRVPTVAATIGATAATAAIGAAPQRPVTRVSVPYRLAYRMAWRARDLLRPVTSLAFRNRMREALIRRAFPPSPLSALPAPAVVSPDRSMTPTVGPTTAAYPSGVTVIGYVKAESGVGESARATLRALAHSGVPHNLRDYRVGNVSRMDEQVDERLATPVQHAVSLFHINADQMPLARGFLGEAPFQVPYRIGFWAWELENFPAEWQGAFAHVDEVWVPSSFCQRAIAASAPVPVLVLPHAVDIPSASMPDRARFKLRSNSVVFLAMADMMSMASRKNPFGAVEAFADAFRDAGADVEMVVKISNGERDPEALKRLQGLAASCPGIHLLADYLDRPGLNSLLDSVDCFVSLHRSEGFGLVIAEAMARSKVVVATGWSGNSDFMNADNALPLDYRLVTLAEDVGPYRAGQRWAEPSMEDAVDKLRRVASDAAWRQRLGQRAREHCRLHLAPEVVGALQRQRLLAIHQSRGLALSVAN